MSTFGPRFDAALDHWIVGGGDGGWRDGIDDCECSQCGEMLDDEALDSLNDESEPDTENALCTACRKKEEDDGDE